MKKVATPTFCPIFSGFYNTLWEPDFESEDHYLREQGFIGDVSENFDNKKYENDIAKMFCNRLVQELKDFVHSIEFESLYSPQYYNYSTDSINCTITPKITSIRKYIYAHKTEYEKFLEENYKSRSGFSSFYDYDFESWKDYTKDFKDYSKKPLYLGSVLDFICQNEGLDNSSIYEWICGNYGISEYMSNDIYNLISKAEDFVRVNYSKDNLLELMQEKFEEDTKKLDFEVIINRIVAEIEGNTLSLTF